MAKLAIIDNGVWEVPRNEVIKAETPEIFAENRRHTVPGSCVLIWDDKLGRVLWDTGITADWETTWPEQFKRDYRFKKLNGLRDKLLELGLTPGDIDMLICSHLHYDHAGNVKLFANTKAGREIIISEAEAHEAFVKTAMAPDGVSGAYFRDELIMDGIGYRTITEDTWISDDIFLFIQRGHTPGVIGLLVKTRENGNLIFPSDAVYSRLNFGPPVVLPGLCVDPVSYEENVSRLQRLQKEYDAEIVFSHDLEAFNEWKPSPYIYE